MEPVVGQPRAAVASPSRSVRPSPLRLRERLKALVLLGGAIRSTDLSRGLDRPLVDLPVEPGHSVLDLWQLEASGLAACLGAPAVPTRLLFDATSPLPRKAAPDRPAGALSVERDRKEFRGTGGVLRDACEGYPPEAVVLVSNANQILVEPLADLACALADAGGDVVILAHEDGAPVGLMLVSVAAALAIRSSGFVDFKEQALPQLAGRFDVRVVRRPTGTAVPIRTLHGYLGGVRAYTRSRAGLPPFEGPFSEDWVRTFGLVEPGASVAPDARVHDSVVLDGARVGPGAVVVRSVICRGGVVDAGEVVADRVVSARAESNGRQG